MKKTHKIYFSVSILAIISLSMALIFSIQNNPDNYRFKQKMKDLNDQVEAYETILEADRLFYEEKKVDKAMDLLQKLISNNKEVEVVEAKIKGYKMYLEALEISKQNKLPIKDNYLTDYHKFNKMIDSLNKISTRTQDSLLNKITDLKEQLIQSKKLSTGKENIQVISFKGVRGNKIHYIGEVKDNKANGNGIGIWVTGSVYKGEWKNNIRHGQGFHEWPDGEKFEGTYVDGKRKGFGKYYWPNGERYEGQWVDDKRNGKGTLFDPDGNIRFEGNWTDDKPVKK